MTKEEYQLKTFARRFDDVLYHKRITASEISKRTGISEASLSQYRKGVYLPQGQNLQAIANALGVPTDFLLGAGQYATHNENGSDYYLLENAPAPTLETVSTRLDLNTYSRDDSSDYELNILTKLPDLDTESKKVLSDAIDILTSNRPDHAEVLMAYLKAINRICPSNAK